MKIQYNVLVHRHQVWRLCKKAALPPHKVIESFHYDRKFVIPVVKYKYKNHKENIFNDNYKRQCFQAAAESTIRIKNKAPISVLDGIPIGIKDELNIKDFRTNSGRKNDEPINENDCATVAALRSLGVVIIGNVLSFSVTKNFNSEILARTSLDFY